MKYRLYLKVSKCAFVQEEISFLGHVVGTGKVQIEPEKAVKICGCVMELSSI